jgi:hypothetical protein
MYVCVCMYVCMYVCIMYVCITYIWMCVRIYVCVCMHVCMHVCVRARVCVRTYVHTTSRFMGPLLPYYSLNTPSTILYFALFTCLQLRLGTVFRISSCYRNAKYFAIFWEEYFTCQPPLPPIFTPVYSSLPFNVVSYVVATLITCCVINIFSN